MDPEEEGVGILVGVLPGRILWEGQLGECNLGGFTGVRPCVVDGFGHRSCDEWGVSGVGRRVPKICDRHLHWC